MRRRISIISLLLLHLTFFAKGETIVVDESTKEITISDRVDFCLDIADTITINDLIHYNNIRFMKDLSGKMNFGYTHTPYWFIFSLKNNCSKSQSLFLEVGYPLLYKIEFYQPLGDKRFFKQIAGDGYPFEERIFKHRIPMFEILLKPWEEKSFYLRINSNGDVMNAPLKIWKKDSYSETAFSSNLFLGFYYGLLALILLMNLFYFVTMRDSAYLYYLLYVLFIGIYLLIRDGFAFQYFWPSFTWWANYSVLVFPLLAMIAMLMFTQKTLKTKKNAKGLHKVIHGFNIIYGLCIIAGFTGEPVYSVLLLYANLLVSAGIFIFILVAVISVIRKVKYSTYFLVAILFIVSGSMMVILKNIGLDMKISSDLGIKLGSVIEILILSYALTVRFNDMLKESQMIAIKNLQELNNLKDELNVRLEKQVMKRTQELFDKNRILEESNEEIKAKNIEIARQRDKIARINADMTDSINYAERIQKSIFPVEHHFKNLFKESFVLFLPKDILSGDFYLAMHDKRTGRKILAVADCTGHGVPGALMSVLCWNLLKNTLAESEIISAATVLESVNEKLTQTLYYQDDNYFIRDGMDISLLIVDEKEMTVTFSCAGSRLISVLGGEINDYKGARISVGAKMPDSNIRFCDEVVYYTKGDAFYMFSDGYMDQIGGEDRKKLKFATFKNLIKEVHNKPVEDRAPALETYLTGWQINHSTGKKISQVDDILVVGIQL